MNRKFLLIFVLSLTFIIITTFVVQSMLMISSVIHKTEDAFISSKANQTTLISEGLKKYLLLDDINGAYRQLQLYRSKGLLDEFEIIKDNVVVEKSSSLILKDQMILKESKIYFNTTLNFLEDRESNDNPIWGSIRLYYSKAPLVTLTKEASGKLLINTISILLLLCLILGGGLYLSWRTFLIIVPIIDRCLKNADAGSIPNFVKWIWSPLLKVILKSAKESIKLRAEMENQKQVMALSKLASQVSHDIRSPLAALNMAIKRIDKSLPEEERILLRSQVRRIQDIANDLLSKKKELAQGKAINPEQISTQLLSSCIDEIITEKRLQYRQYLDLNIEGDLDNSYGLFAKINLVEFKRVISNLINNSVDAFSDKKGKVIVHLLDADDTIEVVIEDNGKGIPTHVLDKLGQEGVSHGKENSKDSGSGLGLYHAKTTIEKWGGNFKIESTEGVGTKIILSLPKVQTPAWFVPNIELKIDAEIVILDDDSGIHATWADKLNKLGIDKANIKVNHISNPNDLNQWINSNADYAKKNVIYLFDFELIGFKESGLDLIEKYKLPKAILVTSHYEEDKIQIRCKELNVKLIPKMIAGLVPIKITASEASEVKAESANTIYDALYLDDDTYLRGGWEKAAKNKGVKLITISKPSEFYQYEKNLSKDSTDIYLDSNLGDGEIKGEEFAVELHKLGYKKISMASGYGKEYFSHVGLWLECTGKDSPWEEEW